MSMYIILERNSEIVAVLTGEKHTGQAVDLYMKDGFTFLGAKEYDDQETAILTEQKLYSKMKNTKTTEPIPTIIKEPPQNKKTIPLRWKLITVYALVAIYLSHPFGDAKTTNNSNASVSQSNTGTGERYIDNESLVCVTEETFDKQIELISLNDLHYVRGCFSPPEKQIVSLVDIQMLSGKCKVLRRSDDAYLWSTCEGIKRE